MTTLILARAIQAEIDIDSDIVGNPNDAIDRIVEGNVTTLMISYHGAGGDIAMPRGAELRKRVSEDFDISAKQIDGKPLQDVASHADLFVALYAISRKVPRIGIFYTLSEKVRRETPGYFLFNRPEAKSTLNRLCIAQPNSLIRIGYSDVFITPEDSMRYYIDKETGTVHSREELERIRREADWSTKERDRLYQPVEGESEEDTLARILEYNEYRQSDPKLEMTEHRDWQKMFDILNGDQPAPVAEPTVFGH